jgi:hypothetical protein
MPWGFQLRVADWEDFVTWGQDKNKFMEGKGTFILEKAF